MSTASKPIFGTLRESLERFIEWCRKIATQGNALFLKEHYAAMLELAGNPKEAAQVMNRQQDFYIIPVTMKELCDTAKKLLTLT
jgi:hypothetical protein